MRDATGSEGERAGRSAAGRYDVERRRVRRRRIGVAASLLVAVVAASVAASPVLAARARLAVVALAVVAAAVAAVGRPRPDPERWLRGAAGEAATAALLEDLGGRWAVLHDRRLPGSRANVDHLVIGRRGVWVLDSKAYRAPLRAGWRSVHVGGHRLDTSAVVWEAAVVADRLGVEVRPLVVVHGRGLPRRGRRSGGVRVLPAAGVVRHLRRTRTGVRLDRRAVTDLAVRAAAVLPEA